MKEGRVVLLQSQLAEKEKEIAELKFVIMQRDAELTMRNDQLDKVRFQSDIYAKQVVLKEELINESSSQLATQTERVNKMREALEKIAMDYHEDNPDRHLNPIMAWEVAEKVIQDIKESK